jgi:uncharacterized integral membrane protein (TIGR00697 family)
MTAVLWLAVQLPPAPDWPLQDAFATVYEFVPRIVIASVIAYWLGEITNSFVMSRMKVASAGRRFGIRAVSSTLLGQLVDSVVFVTIAFVGITSGGVLLAAIASGWLFKVVYEVLALPLTSRLVCVLKRVEGRDHFDYGVDYNPLKV